MNLKEITLEELELHSYLYEEGLSCLLHTILFVRAPGPVRPQVPTSFSSLAVELLLPERIPNISDINVRTLIVGELFL
jgi:hypothetical protein